MSARVGPLHIADEQALAPIAARLFAALRGGEYIALRGPLGAGKTTFVRALLRAGGHTGAVRSPTFTLLEPYALAAFEVLHLDLYRIADPDELDMLGIRERFGNAVILVEWPERGEGWLPNADIDVELAFAEPGRTLVLDGHTEAGDQALARLRAESQEMT